MAHCADGKTEAHAGEGACGAEDERKEHRGAPEILEHFLAVLPKPSTHHTEIIPLIRDSALGQVVPRPVERFRRGEPGSLPSPPAGEQQMQDLSPGPGPPPHGPRGPGTKRALSSRDRISLVPTTGASHWAHPCFGPS